MTMENKWKCVCYTEMEMKNIKPATDRLTTTTEYMLDEILSCSARVTGWLPEPPCVVLCCEAVTL